MSKSSKKAFAAKPIAPIDESVSLPAAVRAAGARSDEIHALAYPTEPAPEPAPEPTPEPAPEPTDPALEAAAPTSPPVEVPAIEPVTAPKAPVSPDSWEHKYNSMKGRHDRLETQNRAMSQRMTDLEQMIATMAVTSPPAPQPSVAPPSQSLITAEERAAFGDEFISVAQKAASEKFAPEVEELRATVKNLSARLENVGNYVGQTEREKMHNYLTTNCPNWLQLNNNPEFLDWLALPDAYSGGIKLKLMQAAYAANDAPRVLAFFQGFLSEEAALAPAGEPTPAPIKAPKVSLASLAAPGRAKTAAANIVPAEKPIFTSAQVTQFFAEVAARRWVGREEEKNRIEAQIFEAGREGRIR